MTVSVTAPPLTCTEHTATLTSRTAVTATLALTAVAVAIAIAIVTALVIALVIAIVLATATPGLQRGRWRHRPHRKHRPTNTGRAAMATASRPRRNGGSRVPSKGRKSLAINGQTQRELTTVILTRSVQRTA